MPHSNSQSILFSKYSSLNLKNKIYQVKAIHLASKYLRHSNSKFQILDIGCADGTFASYVGNIFNAKTYGVDISSDPINKAKKILDYACVHDAAVALPFPDKSFSAVFALEVIEHIFDTDFFLSEIYRVLKSGGILIISTPNLASLQNRIALMGNRYPHYLEYSTAGAGHIHLYTSPVLLDQMRSKNFKIREFTSANFVAPYITHPKAPQLYRSLMMKLGDILPTLGSHLIVVAER